MSSSVLCRICAKPQTHLEKLFDRTHSKTLKQFQKLTGKTLIYEENLPEHICQCCIENLTRAYEFRAKLLTVQHYYTTSQYLNTLLTEHNLDKRKKKTKRIERKGREEENITISKVFKAEERKDRENVQKPKAWKAQEDGGSAVEKGHITIVDELQNLEDEIKKTEEIKTLSIEEHSMEIIDELQNLENEFKKVEESKNTAIKGICQYCGKIFKYHGELGRHLRHHEGNKRFQCEFCEHRSYTRIHLKHHKMIHTGERPFPCKYCDKRFTSKHLMNRHMRIHENVRPFVCRYCDKGFSQNSILKAHLISHGESRFNCDACVRSFQSKASLLKHCESNGHLKNIKSESI